MSGGDRDFLDPGHLLDNKREGDRWDVLPTYLPALGCPLCRRPLGVMVSLLLNQREGGITTSCCIVLHFYIGHGYLVLFSHYSTFQNKLGRLEGKQVLVDGKDPTVSC